jgi:hypothetical protein
VAHVAPAFPSGPAPSFFVACDFALLPGTQPDRAALAAIPDLLHLVVGCRTGVELLQVRRLSSWRKTIMAKRELIAPKGDKRYIRRDATGRIKESDDVGRSLTQDRKRKAKTIAKPGQGDKGDRPRSK